MDSLERRAREVDVLRDLLAVTPRAEIMRFVRTWGMAAALRYYDIAPVKFFGAMRTADLAAITVALKAGKISAGEADMLRDIAARPPRPPLDDRPDMGGADVPPPPPPPPA